jgi:hypothetical protein
MSLLTLRMFEIQELQRAGLFKWTIHIPKFSIHFGNDSLFVEGLGKG